MNNENNNAPGTNYSQIQNPTRESDDEDQENQMNRSDKNQQHKQGTQDNIKSKAPDVIRRQRTALVVDEGGQNSPVMYSMSIQDGQTVNMQGNKDDSLDDSDRIDDDVLRDVDAFTSSDEEDEMGFVQDGRLSFAPVTYDVTSMDGPGPNSPMQMSLKAISVGASIRMLKSVGPAASASVLSKMSKVTRTEVKLIQQDQPMQGTLFFLGYTVFYSLAFLCASYLYDRNEELLPFQMLTFRAMFAIICLSILYNVQVKKAVWDDIDCKSTPPLIFRSFQGCMDDLINFTATAVIPLTMIQIVNNMSPLYTLVLAYFMLKERIACFEIAMIVITVCGIFEVVIFANSDDDSSGTDYGQTVVYIIYGFLLANPILNAGGNIAMRKMKKFHNMVVSWYLNWSTLTLNLTICLAFGFGYGPVASFDWVSWMLSFGTGFFGVTCQTCRFMALKRQKASALQKLQPLTTLYSFMFDVLLFNVQYTAMQYGGLAFIFALYVFQGLKFVFYDLPKEKKREAAVRRELENVDKALEEACIRASVLQGRPRQIDLSPRSDRQKSAQNLKAK